MLVAKVLDRKEKMTNDIKIIAQKVLKAIGGTPKVIEYLDRDETSKIPIFIGENRPYQEIVSYATIGLSDYSIGLKIDNKELRVEFIGACETYYDEFVNIVSTCAFNIINDHYSCEPGTVYPNVVSMYYPNLEMKHIFFTTPFLWEGLEGIETADNYISWLMMIPISDKEFDYLRKNGSDKLEDLFEENQIDIFDLSRKSII